MHVPGQSQRFMKDLIIKWARNIKIHTNTFSQYIIGQSQTFISHLSIQVNEMHCILRREYIPKICYVRGQFLYVIFHVCIKLNKNIKFWKLLRPIPCMVLDNRKNSYSMWLSNKVKIRGSTKNLLITILSW